MLLGTALRQDAELSSLCAEGHDTDYLVFLIKGGVNVLVVKTGSCACQEQGFFLISKVLESLRSSDVFATHTVDFMVCFCSQISLMNHRLALTTGR